MAAIFAVGAVAGFAQDPCTDSEGQNAANDNIQKLYKDRTIVGRKAYVSAGKAFLDKYGACESAAALSVYLKERLPKEEDTFRKMEDADAKDKLYKRFDASVKASNWDETYASGKEILAKEPDQLDLMISLGSIGYDVLYAGNLNFKYNDDNIRYAKQAIAALEAGKPAKTYGLFGWSFKTKERALAELNLTIGYIMQVAQKNKKDAAPYLFKATQGASETTKNPIPYELIGGYYFDELNKLTTEIKIAADSQKDTDTPEVAKQKVDDIKAKVALANGTAERAADAFTRAYNLGQAPAYKKKMKDNVEGAYKLRFGKVEGLDAWIAGVASKPFPNPITPVTPISDPEPAAPTTTPGGSTAATTTPVTTTVKPTPPPVVKPVATPTTKPATPPATKPAVPTKPQAVVKKKVVKKRGA